MKNENYSFYDVCEAGTIKELMLTNEEEFENYTAIKYTKRRKAIDVTYAELKEEIDSLGTYLYARDMRNFKIAILGNNSYEWVLSFLTIITGNNIAVPLDKNLKAVEIAEILQEIECSSIIYDSVYIDTITELKKMNIPLKQVIKFSELRNFIAEGRLLLEKGTTSYIYDKVNKEAIAAIFYTSGTTGRSKGVILTQENIISDAISGSRLVFLGEITMPLIPFHQAYSIIAGVIAPMVQRTIILLDPDNKRIMEDFRIFQPDSIIVVPSIIEELNRVLWNRDEEEVRWLKKKIKRTLFLLSHGVDLRKKLSRYTFDIFGGCLKYIICGGSPLEENYINTFRAFGIEILNGYGLTECSAVVSVNRNEFNRPGSVGQVIPECNLRISEEGEILIKGSMVMKGYYKDEELNKKSFKNGWFKTGDIGYIDRDGFLYIVGRKKNVIVLSSGENISSKELENKLMNIKVVKEVSVYEESSKVTAEIFPDYEALTDLKVMDEGKYIRNEVKKFNKRVMKYKRIGKVIIRDKEFPKVSQSKTSLYKIIKMS